MSAIDNVTIDYDWNSEPPLAVSPACYPPRARWAQRVCTACGLRAWSALESTACTVHADY